MLNLFGGCHYRISACLPIIPALRILAATDHAPADCGTWLPAEPDPIHSLRAIASCPVPPERSRHQEKIIKNYYQNRDAIGLQKAQEAVTELYLSEGKKRETVWKRLVSHLEKMGIPKVQIDHLRQQDDPEMVAKTLEKFV